MPIEPGCGCCMLLSVAVVAVAGLVSCDLVSGSAAPGAAASAVAAAGVTPVAAAAARPAGGVAAMPLFPAPPLLLAWLPR